jgi:hypothetical protein
VIKRAKVKGRREGWLFDAFPRDCAAHRNYIDMSAHGKCLLHDLFNGDLSATWNQMKERGWKSRDTLNKAQRELETRGWIVRTRQGGKNHPTLFALTFQPIHHCSGKLEVAASVTSLGFWKIGHNPWLCPQLAAA